MSVFDDILAELATLPRDIWTESTEDEEDANESEPTITIILHEPLAEE